MITFKSKQKTLFERLKKLRENATPSELAIKGLLESMRLNFIFQKGFIQGDYYCIVDFYLPKPYRLCIEVDGEYHLTDEMIKKDAHRDAYLKSRGFSILRIPNSKANTIKKLELLDLITKS